MLQSAAVSTTLPRVITTGPATLFPATSKASVPNPVKTGAAYAQRLPVPTARSRPMTVPKKPPTMSGPWAMGRVGRSGGHAHPKRINPAHTPATRAAIAGGNSQAGASNVRSTILGPETDDDCGLLIQRPHIGHDIVHLLLGHGRITPLGRHVNSGRVERVIDATADLDILDQLRIRPLADEVAVLGM